MPHRLLPTPKRSNRPELLDGPVSDHAALAENLRDLRHTDLLLGATRALWHELRPLLALCPHGAPITLLDVATGDGHTPRNLAAYTRRAGYALQAYASDVLVEALSIGEEQNYRTGGLQNPISAIYDESHRYGIRNTEYGIRLICHDALHIPAADNTIDLVTCSLALHHFGPADAAALLRELSRVARVGVVLIDLQRTWAAYLGAHLMALGPWGSMARHDGPLSVLRAYTPDELQHLLEVSGVPGSVRSLSPLLISVVIAGG